MDESLFDDGCVSPLPPTSDCDWNWDDRVAPVDDTVKSDLPDGLSDFSGIYGDLVGTSGIIDGVLANPDAPLAPGDVEHLDDVRERAGYWGDRIGQIADIEERYDEIDRQIREQEEAQRRHQLEYDTLHEIDAVLREINSWPNVSGGPTHPTFPSY